MDINIKKAIGKAAAICSKQEKCVADVRKKLFDWKLDEEHHQEVIDYLIDEKFINEERFAIAFARDKMRYNKWGKVKIKYHLSAKRISSDIIDTALAELSADDYREIIIDELTKKRRSLKDSDKNILKSKLLRFAASRGFDQDIVYGVLDAVVE